MYSRKDVRPPYPIWGDPNPNVRCALSRVPRPQTVTTMRCVSTTSPLVLGGFTSVVKEYFRHTYGAALIMDWHFVRRWGMLIDPTLLVWGSFARLYCQRERASSNPTRTHHDSKCVNLGFGHRNGQHTVNMSSSFKAPQVSRQAPPFLPQLI